MNMQPVRSGRRGRPQFAFSENQLFVFLVVAFVIVLVLLLALGAQYLWAKASPATAKTTPKSPGVVAVPTKTIAPIFSPTSQADATQQPAESPTLADNVQMVCMYQVQSGEWLGKILGYFYVDYRDTNQYFSRECAMKDNVLQCSAQQLIEVHSAIYPGQWIEVPGVKQVDCLKHEGKAGIAEK